MGQADVLPHLQDHRLTREGGRREGTGGGNDPRRGAQSFERGMREEGEGRQRKGREEGRA